MKIVLFSLLCLFLMGMTSYSYAQQSVPDNSTQFPEVFLQLELRDSNGSLLAYIEADQVLNTLPLELNRFLDNLNNTRKEFFIKDGKKYESQQWVLVNEKTAKKTAYSGARIVSIFEHEFKTPLLIRHDSFQTEPGDSLRIYWTIIRPVS